MEEILAETRFWEALKELKARAKAASAGPWCLGHRFGGAHANVYQGTNSVTGLMICNVAATGSAKEHVRVQREKNAEYIASCDPNTILKLIEKLEESYARARSQSVKA